MSNSPLISATLISPNKTSPRNHKIDTVTIHCFVGNWELNKMLNLFKPQSFKASCNYVIDKDGKIGLCVEEKDRSWCSSNRENDHRAITIECASDVTHPYAINDAVYNSLVTLLVDICKRNPGIGKLRWKADKGLIGKTNLQNMTVHRWFANKACPGDYIYARLGKIANEVNEKLENKTTAKSFRVRAKNVNIFKVPGEQPIGKNTGEGIFTIEEVKMAPDPTLIEWGRLRSGLGWIPLKDTTKL